MKLPFRILLAEDHHIFRELIRKNLGEIEGIEVVGEVGDGAALLDEVEKLRPDMVVLDIGLPNLSGLEGAKEIKTRHPEIKVLMLTMHKSRDYLTRALEARVDGYLLKDNAFTDLVAAIQEIREGRVYISGLLTQQLLDAFSRPSQSKFRVTETLTSRETEVLKLFTEGKSNKEIAEMLLISGTTVRIHMANIRKKLDVRSNTELVRYIAATGK
jgi:DNA-binding NarL/FixJ family response regulator